MIFDLEVILNEKDEPKSLYSIGVTVYEINDVAWENLQTRVFVQLGKKKKFTKVRESSARPFFNEYFTFDYEGSLSGLMDKLLIIGVQTIRPCLRSNKLLGSARLDLGAIWTQPGHTIVDKWIVLTHPSDPNGSVRGYMNCEIAILPSGYAQPIRRFREPTGYFIPEEQGAGRLKARYIFRVHRGEDLKIAPGKGAFVRVFFAGLTGETTKRRTRNATWGEEIVFNELFPPLYNRLRIDVHFGKKIRCSKYINLSEISDPSIKGYLPTYGPSFLFFYKPRFTYLGTILVTLDTKTVHAFSEHEKLLGVRRQKAPELLEKIFWNIETFSLFAVIYEVSMLNFQGISDFEITIGMSFCLSDENPYSETNMNSTYGGKPVRVDDFNWCLPQSSSKQTLYIEENIPDLRPRLFISNRLIQIAQVFGKQLNRIQFLMESSPESVNIQIDRATEMFINDCHQFKSTAIPGPTKLDQERFQSISFKVGKIIEAAEDIQNIDKRSEKFHKCVELFQEIIDLSREPQETFPMVILTLKRMGFIIAFARIHVRDILFSPRDQEKGINCGRRITIFLERVGKITEKPFCGKIDVHLWFGPFQSIGFGITSIAGGFQDLSDTAHFPESFDYNEYHVYSCRFHLYQGHFLPCDDISGACSLFVKIYFDCKSASSSEQQVLSPMWMETIVIRNVIIYGDKEAVYNNPPQVTIEVWNRGPKEQKLMGRHNFQPIVFLQDEFRKRSFTPGPQWNQIFIKKHVKGEILSMLELVEETPDSSNLDVTEPIRIPKVIKFRTEKYKFELLFWGVRGTSSLSLSSLKSPTVVVNFGSVKFKSFPIKNPSHFPNFSQPIMFVNVELPEELIYAPPLIVRLYDTRFFGTEVFIGSCTLRNMEHLVQKYNQIQEEFKSVKSLKKSVRLSSVVSPIPEKHSTVLYDEEYQELMKSKMVVEEKIPLVELQYHEDVKETTRITRSYFNFWKNCFLRFLRRRHEEEDGGTLQIGVGSIVNDFDLDVEFYDWWTKYFESLPWKQPKVEDEPNVQKRTTEVLLNILGTIRPVKIKFYTEELEKQPDFEGFQDVFHTFRLTKSTWKRQNDAGIFKASLAIYKAHSLKSDSSTSIARESRYHDEGLFAGVARELGAMINLVIRVYIVKAHQLSSSGFPRVNSFIEINLSGTKVNISDSRNCVKDEKNPLLGRVFELSARLPFDSMLTVKVMNKTGYRKKELIGRTEIDIENRYYSRHRGTCGLQRVYQTSGYNRWRDCEKPSDILEWKCHAHNLPMPDYREGYVECGGLYFEPDPSFSQEDSSPEVKNENLALSVLLNWDKLPVCGCKLVEDHVETRSLYNPLQPGVVKGKLEMWVDLFPATMEIPAPINIAPRVPVKYELRVVVWSTKKVILVDSGAMVGKRNTDILVKGWLRGKEDEQSTDVHYASLTGEGFFNWRFIFDINYDREERMIVLDDNTNRIPPIFHVQIWDHERIRHNQYIGSAALDLRDIPPPWKKIPYSKKYLPIKGWNKNLFRDRTARGWWPVFANIKPTGKKKKKKNDYKDKDPRERKGMVDLEFTLLTMLEAERSPAGRGRNDPDALPLPIRPIMKYTIWIVPFRAIKNFLWTYHKFAIFKCLFYVFVALFLAVALYALPQYAVKKLLHA